MISSSSAEGVEKEVEASIANSEYIGAGWLSLTISNDGSETGVVLSELISPASIILSLLVTACVTKGQAFASARHVGDISPTFTYLGKIG